MLTQPHVKRILQKLFVVGADVEGHRKRTLRIDARAGRVKGELTDGDPHAVHTEVSQAQNTLAVGHDDDVNVMVGDVGDEFAHAAAVFA